MTQILTSDMTHDEFILRCETIWEKGHARPELFRLMREWLDALMRYEHTQFSHGQGQGKDWLRFLNAEFERTNEGNNTLANDGEGYALQELAAKTSISTQSLIKKQTHFFTKG